MVGPDEALTRTAWYSAVGVSSATLAGTSLRPGAAECLVSAGNGPRARFRGLERKNSLDVKNGATGRRRCEGGAARNAACAPRRRWRPALPLVGGGFIGPLADRPWLWEAVVGRRVRKRRSQGRCFRFASLTRFFRNHTLRDTAGWA